MKKMILTTLLGLSLFATNSVVADEIPLEVRQQLAQRTIEIIAERRGIKPSEVKLFTDSHVQITVEKYGSGNEVYHYRYIPDQEEENRRLRGNVRW